MNKSVTMNNFTHSLDLKFDVNFKNIFQISIIKPLKIFIRYILIYILLYRRKITTTIIIIVIIKTTNK